MSTNLPSHWQAYPHTRGVTRLAYSKDGRYLYTVGRNENLYQIEALGPKSSDWKSIKTGEAPKNALANLLSMQNDGEDDESETDDEMDEETELKKRNLVMGLAVTVSFF